MLSSYLSNFRRTLGRNATKGKEYSFTSWATSSRATKVGFVHSFARFAQIEARRPRQELTGRAASDTRPDDTRRGPPAALERPTATSVRKLTETLGSQARQLWSAQPAPPIRSNVSARARCLRSCALPAARWQLLAIRAARRHRQSAGSRAPGRCHRWSNASPRGPFATSRTPRTPGTRGKQFSGGTRGVEGRSGPEGASGGQDCLFSDN